LYDFCSGCFLERLSRKSATSLIRFVGSKMKQFAELHKLTYESPQLFAYILSDLLVPTKYALFLQLFGKDRFYFVLYRLDEVPDKRPLDWFSPMISFLASFLVFHFEKFMSGFLTSQYLDDPAVSATLSDNSFLSICNFQLSLLGRYSSADGQIWNHFMMVESNQCLLVRCVASPVKGARVEHMIVSNLTGWSAVSSVLQMPLFAADGAGTGSRSGAGAVSGAGVGAGTGSAVHEADGGGFHQHQPGERNRKKKVRRKAIRGSACGGSGGVESFCNGDVGAAAGDVGAAAAEADADDVNVSKMAQEIVWAARPKCLCGVHIGMV
jgi:hypothetical protein